MQGQTTSGFTHSRQGLLPYTLTSQAGGVVVSPSPHLGRRLPDYTAGYPPNPPPSWAPTPPYSQCALPPHLPGGVPPHQQSQGRLSQLDLGALPTYEEAMRA